MRKDQAGKPLDETTTVGELVAEDYRTARVFEKHGIDFSCGGKAAHLRDEEEKFFPALKRIEAARKAGVDPEIEDLAAVRESLEKFDVEHTEIGDAVHAIRALSKDYAVPDDACNTYMVTYRQLKEFGDDLHLHVHLENNILFPKAAGFL